jgi:hypothetical protein
MLDLYADDHSAYELHDLETLARRRLKSDARAAARLLVAGLQRTDALEQDYRRLVGLLYDAFRALGMVREALSAAWYLDDPARQKQWLDQALPIDVARTQLGWAARSGVAAQYATAAVGFEGTGRLARAAWCYEKAAQPRAARALWARLAELLDARGNQYCAGLCHFNVARTTESAATPEARKACRAAVHRLEVAADAFAAVGQRERAFDCYHALVAIGQLSGEFEHVLEGIVNASRVLSEDNLKQHATRWRWHGVALAEQAGELSAAASLARDLAEYAARTGDAKTARDASLREAELWWTFAGRLALIQNRQLAESAGHAAALAYASAGHYDGVIEVFEQLAALQTELELRERYLRAATRYTPSGQTPQPMVVPTPFPAPPSVWHDDVFEWEDGGDPAEATADVLLDPALHDDPIPRRSALLARLVSLAANATPSAQRAQAQTLLARQLERVGVYSLLAPLEHLYRSELPVVRRAVVHSLAHYPYKRTFVTLEQAAEDDDDGVRDEAARTIKRLRFEHALDPLLRIYRGSSNDSARLAALVAIASLDVAEAAELTLSALEDGTQIERAAVSRALARYLPRAFVTLARAVLSTRDAHGQARLNALLMQHERDLG